MNHIQKYISIKHKITDLEAQRKELEASVMSEVMSQDGEKLLTKWGLLSVTPGAKKWEYSQKLQDQEQLIKDKLKVMKKEEEVKGTAKLLSAPSILKFQANKEAK